MKKNSSSEYKVRGTTDLTQRKYSTWKSLCGPTATANLIWQMSSPDHQFQRLNLNPLKIFAREPTVVNPPMAYSSRKDAASDILIKGLRGVNLHKSLSSMMKTSDKGSTTENIIKGTLRFLTQNDKAMDWKPELSSVEFKNQKKLLTDLVASNRAAVLFVKLNTPPPVTLPILEAKLVGTPSKAKNENLGSVEISLVPGTENVSNGLVSGQLVVRDAKNPNRSLTNIDWKIRTTNGYQQIPGNSPIIDFKQKPGKYWVYVRGKTATGQNFIEDSNVTLEYTEKQTFEPKIKLSPKQTLQHLNIIP